MTTTRTSLLRRARGAGVVPFRSCKARSANRVFVTGLVVALVPVVATGLALTSEAAAGGKTVRATLNGTCNETDKLDQNGALKSASILCKGAGKCACQGSPKLAYSVTAVEPGNGAPGTEHGTITATGPTGTLTFALSGKHSAIGGGTGTWKLIKTVGYKGVQLLRKGTYSSTIQTHKQIPQSMITTVRIATNLSCWQC